jgi:hypothetical protein
LEETLSRQGIDNYRTELVFYRALGEISRNINLRKLGKMKKSHFCMGVGIERPSSLMIRNERDRGIIILIVFETVILEKWMRLSDGTQIAYS